MLSGYHATCGHATGKCFISKFKSKQSKPLDQKDLGRNDT